MNIQLRDFFQRAVRTFGSPFQTRREKNPRRSAEETLESQTGPSQMGQEDEAQLTTASNDNASSIANAISVLSRNNLIPPEGIQRSRASTRYDTKSKSEDSQQSPQSEHRKMDKPQFTEGPSRIVMASDGTKDCMALLLTERMVREFNSISEETRKIEKAEKELAEARFKASMAELQAKELDAKAAKTEDPDLINDISEKIEAQRQIFTENNALRESLRELLVARNGNLQYRQDVFQNIFRRALQDSDLLNLLEVKAESLHPSGAAGDSRESITVSETDESIVSMEELLRRNAYDDLEFTRQNLASRQNAFDNRHVKYARALDDFQEARADGTTSCTQTEFDCLAVGGTRKLTRALIDAEADYERAAERAKALGVLYNADDQESNFISDISDGYHVSEEASMRAAVNRTFIQYWNDTIVGSGPEELDEPPEPDDWDAETVGISDSVSVVDHSRNRKRIDRWREMCGLMLS